MPTGRDLISDIRSKDKLISGDNIITDRAIFNELKSTASLLIKQETNQRKLWNSPNIFTAVECLLMEQVPLSECCEYKSPFMVARSKKEIPQISEGIFGLLVQSIYSPGMTNFDFTTLPRLVNILKLGLKNPRHLFFIQNKKVYVTAHNLEYINMNAYFDSDIDPNDYGECKSEISSTDKKFVNPLDRPFKIPSYMEKSLKDWTHKSLLESYFRLTEDTTSDNQDTSGASNMNRFVSGRGHQ